MFVWLYFCACFLLVNVLRLLKFLFAFWNVTQQTNRADKIHNVFVLTALEALPEIAIISWLSLSFSVCFCLIWSRVSICVLFSRAEISLNDFLSLEAKRLHCLFGYFGWVRVRIVVERDKQRDTEDFCLTFWEFLFRIDLGQRRQQCIYYVWLEKHSNK